MGTFFSVRVIDSEGLRVVWARERETEGQDPLVVRNDTDTSKK